MCKQAQLIKKNPCHYIAKIKAKIMGLIEEYSKVKKADAAFIKKKNRKEFLRWLIPLLVAIISATLAALKYFR